jgi:hypothetical protein
MTRRRIRTFSGSSNRWFEDVERNNYRRYIIIKEETGEKGE